MYDFERAKNWIKSKLSEERYLHSLGAEESARELAIMFGEDEEKAAFTALIHDNAKDISYEDSIKLIEEDGLDIEESIKSNRKIIHSYIGAHLAEIELGITDGEILDAIKFHTTGKSDMTLFEKIIYLADKIEANTRELDFRENILNILKETNMPKQKRFSDLAQPELIEESSLSENRNTKSFQTYYNVDKAILFCLDNTIRSLLDRKLPINYITIEVWNNFLKK